MSDNAYKMAEGLRKIAKGYECISCCDYINLLSTAAVLEETLKKEAAGREWRSRCHEVHQEVTKQCPNVYELINKMPLEGNEEWHGYLGSIYQTMSFLDDFFGELESEPESGKDAGAQVQTG